MRAAAMAAHDWRWLITELLRSTMAAHPGDPSGSASRSFRRLVSRDLPGLVSHLRGTRVTLLWAEADSRPCAPAHRDQGRWRATSAQEQLGAHTQRLLGSAPYCE
jgi:hypothetical protein